MARSSSFIYSTSFCFPSSLWPFKNPKHSENVRCYSKNKIPPPIHWGPGHNVFFSKTRIFQVSIFENFKQESKFALGIQLGCGGTLNPGPRHQSWHSSEQPEWTAETLQPEESTERLTCTEDDLQNPSSKALQSVWVATKRTEPWQSVRWAAQI